MAKLGVITLGLNPQGNYLAEFLEKLKRVSNMDMTVFDYKSLDPTQIAESSVDALVLSPGNAKIGLATASRAERDPHVQITQLLVQNAVYDRIPILGVNVGHQLLNNTYNHGIEKVGDGYHEEGKVSLKDVEDPITDGVDELVLALTNNWGVPLKQESRFGQNQITQLVEYKGFALISKGKFEAPTYGVQFNIQPENEGNKKIFENFFKLALQHLETR